MTNKIQKESQIPDMPAPYKGKHNKQPAPGGMPANFVRPTQRSQQAQPNVGSYGRSPAVKQMQTSIQDLYQSFKHYPMFSMKPDYRETDMGQSGAEYGQNYEHGSDTFLTSMLNRYVAKSDVVGSENLEKGQEPGKLTNLIKLIETLNTFGKGNTNPDGAWGLYTNNALKNLYAIVQAMMSIMNSLHITQDVYTDGDLQDLKKLIPDDVNLKDLMKIDGTTKTIDELASEITKNIAKIKMLLGSFVNGTTGANSKYAPYINQQKALETNYGKKPSQQAGGSRGYEQSQVPVLSVMLPRDIADNEQGNIPLLLGNLANKDSFMEFVKQNGITVDGKDPLKDQSAMNELVENIENRIKSANVSPAPQPREAGR